MPAVPLVTAAFVALTSLVCSSEAQSASSRRVGDYDEGSQLPTGASLPLYTLTWRAVGYSFAESDFMLNSTFTSDANTAFGEAPHKMIYTAVNIRDAAAFNTTRTSDGQTGEPKAALLTQHSPRYLLHHPAAAYCYF